MARVEKLCLMQFFKGMGSPNIINSCYSCKVANFATTAIYLA